MSEFNGSDKDFSDWEKQVLLLSATYELDDNCAKILISSKLKGNALEWFHSKSEHIEMSMDNLLTEMRRMFDHRPKKLERRRIFEERKWQRSEPFSHYYHNKLILRNQVPVDEDEMIDYLIDGIPDVQLRNQARMRKFGHSSELLEAFNKILLPPDTSKGHPKGEARPADFKATWKPTIKEEGKRTLRCYNCRMLGHTSDQCRQPKKQICYKCNESGHMARDCPVTKAGVNFVDEVFSVDSFFRSIEVVLRNGKHLNINCVLDSGSPISFIKIECMRDEVIERATETDSRYAGINQSNLSVLGKISVSIILDGEICNDVKLLVVPDDTMKSSLVLGRDVLNKFALGLAKVEKGKGPENFETKVKELNNIDIYFVDEEQAQPLNIDPKVPHKIKSKLLEQFKVEYIESVKPEVPKIKAEVKINLTDDKLFSLRQGDYLMMRK